MGISDFFTITGQKSVKSKLINYIENDNVSHAYVFTGPKGIGKKTMAYAFSGALLCNNQESGKRCTTCRSCNTFQNGTNPDFVEIITDKSSIGIESIREFQKNLLNRPMYSKRKVCVIPDAEKMTVQAQNCLLKTLEEPPSYVVIILTTSNYDSLLETLRSRTVKTVFNRYSDDEMQCILRDNKTDDLMEFNFITSYAEGLPGRAFEIIENEEFIKMREDVLDYVLSNRNKPELWQKLQDYTESNKDIIEEILSVLLIVYRDILMAACGQQKRLINSDKKDIIVKYALMCNMRDVITKIRHIEEMRKALKFNANAQLVMDVLQLKLNM